MRADRLISILLLLQVHRRITARELASRLEVSERTIHRDMEALSTGGAPVFAERGAGGGWALMEEYRTNLTGLNKAESQSLFLLKPAQLLADLGLEKASDAALIKLLAALPAMHRGDADDARQRIHIDLMGWNRSEERVPVLPTLQEAVWQERRLQLTYERGGDCGVVERRVDPLGLVAKGSVWYLVCSVEGEIRSYRVSRIKEAVVTSESFLRPEGFDLAAYWQESAKLFKANLPKYQAVLRVKKSILPKLPYAGRFARIEQVDPVDASGWARVSMRFQFEEEACEYVLSFGPRIEVLEPDALRQRVVDMAQSVIEFYSERSRPVRP
jgi:predicted DNA-binding transcriptional regulator YafY